MQKLYFLDKLGWAVETTYGQPIRNFIRLLIHTRRITTKRPKYLDPNASVQSTSVYQDLVAEINGPPAETKMSIDSAKLEGFTGGGVLSTVFSVISPYLPILGRAGKAGVDAFMKHATAHEWDRVDAALYEHMTEEERDALSDSILQDARKVVKEAYEDRQSWNNDLFRVVLSALLTVI